MLRDVQVIIDLNILRCWGFVKLRLLIICRSFSVSLMRQNAVLNLIFRSDRSHFEQFL